MAKGDGYSNQWGNEPWGALPGGQIVRGKRAGVKKLSTGMKDYRVTYDNSPRLPNDITNYGRGQVMVHGRNATDAFQRHQAGSHYGANPGGNATQTAVVSRPGHLDEAHAMMKQHGMGPVAVNANNVNADGRWVTINGHHVLMKD